MDNQSVHNSKTYINPLAQSYISKPLSPEYAESIQTFHKTLPDYAATPLISFPSIAKELGVSKILVKDESHRFGLPSFKILGASWAIASAVASKVGLDVYKSSLQELGTAARHQEIRLITCSDGNWGRAVARFAKYLSIPATIFVPEDIDDLTQTKITSEGAECHVNPGDYNAAIERAIQEAENVDGSLLAMDMSWPGYENIPLWVTEGYQTMLSEVENQATHLIENNSQITHAICSVGVGSWAHAVVTHFKSPERAEEKVTVATVEPVTAASLQNSLHHNQISTISTDTSTIMCGMNCGTPSTIAWPVLRDGVDVSFAVTDWDAHQALLKLKAAEGHGLDEGNVRKFTIDPGPCGAAPLAALKKMIEDQKTPGLDCETMRNAVVLLFCTEGFRDYPIPQQG